MHKQIKPISHVATSAAISAIGFWISGSKAFAIVNFLTGVFIDIDHFLDYYLNHKKFFLSNVADFYDTCMNYRITKLFVIFHSLEVLPILWLIATIFPTNMIWWGLTIGITQHLISDMIVNKIYLKGYFLTYRLIKKFDTTKIMKCDEP